MPAEPKHGTKERISNLSNRCVPVLPLAVFESSLSFSLQHPLPPRDRRRSSPPPSSTVRNLLATRERRSSFLQLMMKSTTSSTKDRPIEPRRLWRRRLETSPLERPKWTTLARKSKWNGPEKKKTTNVRGDDDATHPASQSGISSKNDTRRRGSWRRRPSMMRDAGWNFWSPSAYLWLWLFLLNHSPFSWLNVKMSFFTRGSLREESGGNSQMIHLNFFV